MDNLNLQLQQNWLNNKRILCYTLYSLNNSTMQDWAESVFTTLADWPGVSEPCILFDLSNPNVSMSYFVLTGRDLFNFVPTPESQQAFQKLVASHPDLRVKLAVLLSQTMAGVITEGRRTTNVLHQVMNGKVFFDRELALQWLNADVSPTPDTRTRTIDVNDLLQETELGALSRDMYRAGINQLRLLVNGSLEIIPVAEGKPILIGRNPKADVDLSTYGKPSLTVSRNHAQLSLANGEVSILDLNSTNGTLVGDKRLEPGKARVLKRDEEIHIGAISLRVLI